MSGDRYEATIDAQGIQPDDPVTRIEWRYLDDCNCLPAHEKWNGSDWGAFLTAGCPTHGGGRDE